MQGQNSKTSTASTMPLVLTVESMTRQPRPEFSSNAASRFPSVERLLNEIETAYDRRNFAA